MQIRHNEVRQLVAQMNVADKPLAIIAKNPKRLTDT